MRRCADRLLEKLAQIIVVEGQGAEILIQLQILVRVVADDVACDLLNNGILYRRVQISADEDEKEVCISRKQNRLLAGFAAEMIEDRSHGVQNEVVAVVVEHSGLTQTQGGLDHIEVNVGKAGAALVAVVDHRRNQKQIARLVGNAALFISKLAFAGGAVYKLPARVGMC